MRLHYAKVVNLSKLHDELLAALPALATTMRVEGNATEAWITVPDDASQMAIDNAVAAHNPAVAAAPPDPPSATAITDLHQIAQSSGDLTPTQLANGMRALLTVVRYRTGDV